MSDYYDILGISKSATDEEIKTAYRKLAKIYHPDKGGDKNKFQEIQKAYETLSDSNKRNNYNNSSFQQQDNPHFPFEHPFFKYHNKNNIIKKIFPSNNLLLDDLLKYDDVGLYSITLPDDANTISKLLLEYSNNIIFDGTAGLGGNTLSFSKNFKQVIAIEMNEHRYNLLVNNLKAYDVKNVTLFNDNCFF